MSIIHDRHGEGAPADRGKYLHNRKRKGGPELDWDCIQPQLFLAECDVIILLDCCFAGQAVRSRFPQRVEFLAATDKDQYTATGLKGIPSFTAVLTEQARSMMDKDGVVTISELHRVMLQAEHGLMRQPFYAILGGGNQGAGAIKLRRIPEANLPLTTPSGQNAGPPIYFRLSLLDQLDAELAMSLVQWMTKDSPTFIKNIQLVDSVLSDAKRTNDVGSKFVARSKEESLLPQDAQLEAARLCETLEGVFRSRPSSALQTASDARALLGSIKRSSADVVTFLEDALTQLTPDTLYSIRDDAGDELAGLKQRIDMRLAVSADEDISEDTGSLRIVFPISTLPAARLKSGTRGDHAVLVEYFTYTDDDPNSYAWTARQIRRIATLQSEPKSSAFRCLESLGYTQESLGPARLGVVYKVPEDFVDHGFITLANLIPKLKTMPLENRYHLAVSLCNAMLHLHSIGWYHKNLTSLNVVIFARERTMTNEERSSSWAVESPFVVGFDTSRPTEAETRNTVDFSAKNYIYRHPDRWGRPVRFERHHDLYSLVSSAEFSS